MPTAGQANPNQTTVKQPTPPRAGFFMEVHMRVKRLFIVSAIALLGFAFAQETAPVEGFDFAAAFANTAALAGLVAAAVAFVKRHLIKSLDGLGTVLASLVLGAGFGVLGNLLGYIEGGMFAGVSFGVSAGFLAAGGYDAITSLLSKRKAA